jgi:hypothetical protein
MEFWHTKKSKGCYSKYHLRWLARHVGSHLSNGDSITGCIEHLKDGQLFRAPPSYRGRDCWHDWVMCQWEDDDGGTFDTPGHIIMFLHIDTINAPIIFDGDRLYIDEPGLYCMVECFDNPFAKLTMKGIIVEEQIKQVRVTVPGWGAPQRVSDKCIYLHSSMAEDADVSVVEPSTFTRIVSFAFPSKSNLGSCPMSACSIMLFSSCSSRREARALISLGESRWPWLWLLGSRI